MLSAAYGRLWMLWQGILGRRWFVSCDMPDGPDCSDFQDGEAHRCSVIVVGYHDRLGHVHITNVWPVI